MWNKTGLKVFCLLSLLSTSILALSIFVSAKVLLEREETARLEYVSTQAEWLASRVEQSGSQAIDTYRHFILLNSAEASLEQLVSDTTLQSQIRDHLPQTGSAARFCKWADETRAICVAVKLSRASGWLVGLQQIPQLKDIIFELAKAMVWPLIALILFSIGASLFLARFFTRPLQNFVKATQALSQNESAEVPLPVHRGDEIGELARSFQDMIQAIREREKNIADTGVKLAHSARLATIGQMGASIAHEVKNPLMAMHGHAKVLKQKADNQELVEIADILVKESERCNQILQQMLRFSRSDSQEKANLILKELVESTLQLVRAEAKRRHVEIRSVWKGDPIVQGNAQQIQQVFLNILLNAIQAAPTGSTIDVVIEEKNHQAILSVQDRGPGISEEIRSKIFDPFFTTKDKKEGSGLGLSIAATLIAEQGGHIDFESSPQGTRFDICLPLRELKSA